MTMRVSRSFKEDFKDFLRNEVPKHSNKDLDLELAHYLDLQTEYENFQKMPSFPSSKSLQLDKLLQMWSDTEGEGATLDKILAILKEKKEFTAIVQKLKKLM